jgi:hypothetical protein
LTRDVLASWMTPALRDGLASRCRHPARRENKNFGKIFYKSEICAMNILLGGSGRRAGKGERERICGENRLGHNLGRAQELGGIFYSKRP